MTRVAALLILLLTTAAQAQTTIIRNAHVRVGGKYLLRQVELQGSKISKIETSRP